MRALCVGCHSLGTIKGFSLQNRLFVDFHIILWNNVMPRFRGAERQAEKLEKLNEERQKLTGSLMC